MNFPKITLCSSFDCLSLSLCVSIPFIISLVLGSRLTPFVPCQSAHAAMSWLVFDRIEPCMFSTHKNARAYRFFMYPNPTCATWKHFWIMNEHEQSDSIVVIVDGLRSNINRMQSSYWIWFSSLGYLACATQSSLSCPGLASTGSLPRSLSLDTFIALALAQFCSLSFSFQINFALFRAHSHFFIPSVRSAHSCLFYSSSVRHRARTRAKYSR